MQKDIRLVAFDMEGTLTTDPTVWELMHLKIGTWESHGLRYWGQFKAGGMDYDEFARKDVATWRGAPSRLLDEVVAEVPMMKGCGELLRFLAERGISSAIISNGLERLGFRLAERFPVARVAANREVVEDGRLTGELNVLVPFREKAAALRRVAADLGVRSEEVMTVGDGIADIPMFQSSGRSVAFCPENETVAAAADHRVEEPDLTTLIPLFL